MAEKKKPVELNHKLKLPDLPKTNSSAKVEVEEKRVTPKKVKIGDHVKLKHQSKTGVVQSIDGKKIKVLMGNFVISTNLSELEV